MSYQNIAKLVPTLMSARLVSDNIIASKKKKKKLISLGVNNIVGTSLIQANAQFLGGY